MTFDEFAEQAAELFGLTANEAADLADQLDDAMLTPDAFDVDDQDYWSLVSDAIEDEYFDEYYYEPPEMYPLDPYFPDDEYLDPGEMWEVSAEAYTD